MSCSERHSNSRRSLSRDIIKRRRLLRRTQSLYSISRPYLWELVDQSKWQQVMHRTMTHPKEILYRTQEKSYCQTCLDLAVSDRRSAGGEEPPPLHVVEVLLEGFDETDVEACGRALQIACDVGCFKNDKPLVSDDMLKLFLRKRPLAAKLNRLDIATMRRIGFSASFFYDKRVHGRLQVLAREEPTLFGRERVQQALQQEESIRQIWDKAWLLTKARYYSSTSIVHFKILHAFVGAIKYTDNLDFVRLAIKMHPEQVKEADSNRNLPLHIAAMSDPRNCINRSDRADQYTAISLLLAAYPHAASIRNIDGKLPIQLALETKKMIKHGFVNLWKAHPIYDPEVMKQLPKDLFQKHCNVINYSLATTAYSYRLCFACMTVKKFSVHFCQEIGGWKDSAGRRCRDCVRRTSNKTFSCACCSQTPIIQTLTKDTISYIFQFISLLDKPMSLAATCRQFSNMFDSTLALAFCHLVQRSEYHSTSNFFNPYDKQLGIMRNLFDQHRTIVKDVVRNLTASTTVKRDLLLVAVERNDMENVKILLAQSNANLVDGALDKALCEGNKDIATFLQSDDRVRQGIVYCSRCGPENIACRDCELKNVMSFSRRACMFPAQPSDISTPSDIRFCITCVGQNFCSICGTYRCYDCGERDYYSCSTCHRNACGSDLPRERCFEKCFNCDKIQCKICGISQRRRWNRCNKQRLFCNDCNATGR